MTLRARPTGDVLSGVMRPGSWLLSRLRYVWKFVIIGLALMLPLAFVATSYVDQQRASQAFSAKERVGLRYLAATTGVLDELIASRAAAVSAAIDGAPVATMRAELTAAIGALDAADSRDGDELGLRSKWTEVQAAITAGVAKPGDARAVFYAYSAAVDSVLKLVVEIGERSNLILDPDLDSFYVMDALVTQLPRLSDSAGRVADLQHVMTTERTDDEEILDREAYTLANSTLVTATATLAANLNTATTATSDDSLGADIAKPSETLAAKGNRLANEGASVVTVGSALMITADDYHEAATKLRTGAQAALDRLLVTRIGGLQRQERLVELVALVGGLLAAYLFYAFYRSVTRSVGAVVAATRRLAEGDLTTRVRVDGRDELADIAVAVNAAVDRMRAALMSIADHASSLDSASTEVSVVSRSLSSLADETESHSKVVAEAAEEVAQQVQVVVTEQLSESLKDFASTAVSANQVLSAANRAVLTVTGNEERMERLAESSRAIGEIVQLINSIAEQTNLLALNATIEAAHAGTAGKGFGIVASEVKDLARETAQATESISQRVKAIRTEADLAMVAASQAKDAILEIQENQQSIAVSMEEQTVLAGGIGRSLGDAVERSTSVARDVASFSQTAGETSSGARDLSASAAHLAAVAAQLTSVVQGFTV
ncbi:MAG: methyl-accepting chemotaxis protein [Mycobacteriales bacterium]